MNPAMLAVPSSCTAATTEGSPRVQLEMLQSAVAALQSSGAAAQQYGAEALLAACVGGTAERRQYLAELNVPGVIAGAILSGSLQAPAVNTALDALEAVVMASASGQGTARELPGTCAVSMLILLRDDTQSVVIKAQAAKMLATMLKADASQITAFREAGGVEALAQVLPKSKVMEEERQAGAAEQTHAALQALSLAVSADALCKEACIDQAMDRLAYCMRDDEVAPHAVDVLAALVEGRPGERGVVRSCAEALCASGIAQPLMKIAAEMPHQTAGVKALEVVRKMTSAGAQSLAVLRKAGCLEACISLVGTTADVDSRGVQLAVMLLRDFADWDVASRESIVASGGAAALLWALHAAELQDIPIRYDINEALGKLAGDVNPDNSSTGGKLLCHWAAQYGDQELVALALDSNPLPDIRDARGNTPLHLATANDRRDVAKQLLRHNADVLTCNGQGKWCLDMADPKAEVWGALYEEITWRSCLEQPRPCQAVLDGWEGPCTCSFAPMQGLLTIAEHSSSSGSPSKSGARWLIRLKSRQGSKPQLPLRVRVPHTTQIRTVGDGAVELEFTSLDPLLGQAFPAEAQPGGRVVKHLLISNVDARPLCSALQLMQQRTHPDTSLFRRLFLEYNQLYEREKAAQLAAQGHVQRLATELEDEASAGKDAPQLLHLQGQIVKLTKDLEDGRFAALEAHRAVLDCCDAAISRLGMLRVEAEKAEEEGRDESWQAVGEHALVSLAIVRAYRERALHAAYSGTLPQLSPRRLPGAPEELIDSEERQMLDALAPSRLRARPSSAAKPFAMRTDLEVLQALHTLGDKCAQLLAHANAAQPAQMLPDTSSSAAAQLAVPMAKAKARSARDLAAATESAGPCTPERITDVAARAGSYSAQRTLPGGGGAGGQDRRFSVRGAQQQPCQGSDSSGEDTLSMTGLIDSGSSDGKQPCKLPESSGVEGRSTGEHCGGGRAGARVSACSESPSAESPSAAPRRRQAAAFMASAPLLAAAAMSLAHVSSEDEGYLTPWHDRADSHRDGNRQRLSSDASEGTASQVSQCEESSGHSGSPCSSSASEELLLERELPALSLHDGGACRASRNKEEAVLNDLSLKDGRRSESFTFAPVSPTRVAAKDDRSIVRATASEPVEVLTFPRLGNGHGLRHGASMPALKAGVRQPVPGSPSALEQAGGLHRLESGLSSGDWTDPAEHQKLAQALEEHLQAGVTQQDGIKQLRALLGTEESLPGTASGSAAQALQKAVAGIAEIPCGGAEPAPASAPRAAGSHAADGAAVGIAQIDIAESLAAELSTAANAAATDAILSSVQVAGEAVRELPSWAGPDVVIAATMSRLDKIVAAANAKFADAMETAVARAAAAVSSLSAETLAKQLQERKVAAGLPLSPRGDGGSQEPPAGSRTSITARFPAFAQRCRLPQPSPTQPSDDASHGEEPASPSSIASSSASCDDILQSPAKKPRHAGERSQTSAGSRSKPSAQLPPLDPRAVPTYESALRSAMALRGAASHSTARAAHAAQSLKGRHAVRQSAASSAAGSSVRGLCVGEPRRALLDTLSAREGSSTDNGELALAGHQFQAALYDSDSSSVPCLLPDDRKLRSRLTTSPPDSQYGDWAAAASMAGHATPHAIDTLHSSTADRIRVQSLEEDDTDAPDNEGKQPALCMSSGSSAGTACSDLA